MLYAVPSNNGRPLLAPGPSCAGIVYIKGSPVHVAPACAGSSLQICDRLCPPKLAKMSSPPGIEKHRGHLAREEGRKGAQKCIDGGANLILFHNSRNVSHVVFF